MVSIQAMPDCQEASEIRRKLEILDRHLQLDMMNCSRRAEGLAFLMVLRFREADRKIILLGCDDKAPSKMNIVQLRITQLKRKIIFHPPPFRQEATKIAEETALCHGGESRGVGAPYRTFLLCSRKVCYMHLYKIQDVCWIDRQSSFFATFTGNIHGKTLSI